MPNGECQMEPLWRQVTARLGNGQKTDRPAAEKGGRKTTHLLSGYGQESHRTIMSMLRLHVSRPKSVLNLLRLLGLWHVWVCNKVMMCVCV